MAQQGDEHDDEKGPIEHVLSALGFRHKARAAPEASGLVGQAEAFQRLTVGDLMIPRADIVALEVATPLSEVAACFIERGHTRLPVYRETLDDPVGFVHIKDVFKLIAGNVARPDANEAVLGRIRRESLYVPASMRAADLLLHMQTRRIHLALVIDEFGGVDGLATVNELVEAVVGEMADVHDVPEPVHVKLLPGGVLEADGRTELEEVEAAIGRPLPSPELDEEIDTIAGLVAAIAGRVPQRGEVIALGDGLEAEITDADPRRVKRLRLRPAAPAAGAVADRG